MGFAAIAEKSVPVLIVGGGGAGLTASMLLARQGVEHLLVSARPTTSDLPKAHVLNQRAVEVLDDVGVADAIAQQSTPAEQMSATAFYAGLTGPDPDYGRRLMRLEAWGAGGEDESWRAASSWRQMNLPQIRLEPLLKAQAEELSPGRIRFNHELIDLEQDPEGVRALIRDNASGHEYTVRCDYLLGADGGRLVPKLIGVEYEGLGVLTQTQVEADARKALGIGDVPMHIHKITRWSVEAVLASAFKVGRVLLLGDAAHRHPPTGGLGLTSAIHDAQNLCWKIGAVLGGHAAPSLLDSYEAERRPVD